MMPTLSSSSPAARYGVAVTSAPRDGG